MHELTQLIKEDMRVRPLGVTEPSDRVCGFKSKILRSGRTGNRLRFLLNSGMYKMHIHGYSEQPFLREMNTQQLLGRSRETGERAGEPC